MPDECEYPFQQSAMSARVSEALALKISDQLIHFGLMHDSISHCSVFHSRLHKQILNCVFVSVIVPEKDTVTLLTLQHYVNIDRMVSCMR